MWFDKPLSLTSFPQINKQLVFVQNRLLDL